MHRRERPGELQADRDHLVRAQVMVWTDEVRRGRAGAQLRDREGLRLVDPEV
jgi:hypothetical protein